MAIAYVGAGTAVTGTAAITVAWPTHRANDLGILVIETGGEGTSLNPSGWTHVPGSPFTDVATSAGSKLHVLYRRALSDVEAPVVTSDSGDHQLGAIYVWRNVDIAAPINAQAVATKAVASTTVTYPTATTSVPDCVAVFVASRPDDSASTTAFSVPSGGTGLTNFAERGEAGTTDGHGGGFVVSTADMVSAGATGTPTATGPNTTNATLTLALKPSVIVPGVDACQAAMSVTVGPEPGAQASQSAMTVTVGPEAGVQASESALWVILALVTPPAEGTEDARVRAASVYTLSTLLSGMSVPEASIYTLGATVAPMRVTESTIYTLGEAVAVSRVTEATIYSLGHARLCLTRECQVWTITRTDGVVYRFTSLDRDLVYGGLTYRACDSMVPSASQSSNEVGASGDINLSGIIGEDEGSITLTDLHAGRFDGALVEAWRVPWDDALTPPRAIMQGTFGAVSFGERGFSVDLFGDGVRLQQTPLLRTVSPGCDLTFGSPACGVDLGPLTVTGTVDSGQGQRGFTDAARAEADGYFNYGVVTFLTGANAGISAEIKSQAGGVFTLWPRLAEPVNAGDTYSMTPGCTRLIEATGGTNGCSAWANLINYGGFPTVPGGDTLQSRPEAKA